jgi:septum formation protein
MMVGGSTRIYLASRSSRRRELLAQIGVPYHILLLREDLRRGADVDESRLPGESPSAHVERVARAKAETGWRQLVARALARAPVLGADTSVVLGDEIFGKPTGTADAVRMLASLAGRTHQVLTAVAIAYGERMETALSCSEVEFRELSDAEIERYAASGEPLDKAGAYAIQGKAAMFTRCIAGSYSGIMGLPLFETTELLRRFGFDVASSLRLRGHA